jgi:hypothetical protein
MSERLKLTRRELLGAGGGILLGVATSQLKPWELFKSNKVEAAEVKGGGGGDEEQKTHINGIEVTNLLSRVEAGNVDFAKGVFENSSGVGNFIFADPGGLLVGPDFGYQGHKSPYGVNAAGWEAMYDSGGSIHPFSPVSQEVARFAPPLFQNLPEGGFAVFTGGRMKVEVGGIAIDATHKRGNTYILAVRGKYPDGVQDSDLNQTAKALDYAPGHFLVEMLQSRDETNLAFISEGWIMQKVATTHSGGTNCGAEGCSLVTLITFDVNTGAFEVWENQLSGKSDFETTVDRLEHGEGWFRKFSNISGAAYSLK